MTTIDQSSTASRRGVVIESGLQAAIRREVDFTSEDLLDELLEADEAG
jgi:hypothetical protein